MGLLGGWWGAAAVGLVAVFLGREYFKYLRGEVVLTARQKTVRVLGGVLLMIVALMTVYSPMALRRAGGQSVLARDARELIYWAVCLGFAVMMLLMAVMDAGEISRQVLRAQRTLGRKDLTRDDVDRILREEAKDHPDEVGRD